MYAVFDYYNFSGAEDFVKYVEFATNSDLRIGASFGTNSIMDEVINALCEHYKDKNILILCEDEFTVDNPRCLTSDNMIETIQTFGQYYPMYLLIIVRKIRSMFINLAVTSFARQYHIPIINMMVDSLNHGKVVWY